MRQNHREKGSWNPLLLAPLLRKEAFRLLIYSFACPEPSLDCDLVASSQGLKAL